MQTIHKLQPEVISKIAAGEVVERPASIIKELVENALDAQATHIDISLEKAGIDKIVVRDDGVGMSAEDVALCFLPHTTSKIETEADLFSITSFGFRGEALSSIASVSSLTITTRQPESHSGYTVHIEHGQAEVVKLIAAKVGTEITIEELFHTLPARRKFLADYSAELREITSIVTAIALAFPHIGFSLINNSKKILSIPAGQSQTQRIQEILGHDNHNVLLPLTHSNRYGTISGFIGSPQSARSAPGHQYLFVNNRPLSPSLISKHITESYGSTIEPRTQGMFIVFLELPFETVDVNIHPRKQEVGFAYPAEIEQLVREAVAQSLTNHRLTYTFSGQESATLNDRGMDSYTAELLKSIVTPWNLKSGESDEILQINNLYLVAPTSKGLLLVDQHAAHERILYEQFKQALETVAAHKKIVELQNALVIELSAADALLLNQELDTFTQLGFDLESFGKNTFKFSALPELFTTHDPKKLLLGVLDDIKNGRKDFIANASNRTLSFLACRAAVKAGDPLDQEERRRLIDKLLEATTPYTCPHGRPTHIELSLKDLDVLFKRR